MPRENADRISIGREKAIALGRSEYWKELSAREIVDFQFYVQEMTLPFHVLHTAMGEVLQRPVFTHEFASSNFQNLHEELQGIKKSPSIDEIMSLFPKHIQVILVQTN